jgi:hypothetical protein
MINGYVNELVTIHSCSPDGNETAALPDVAGIGMQIRYWYFGTSVYLRDAYFI